MDVPGSFGKYPAFNEMQETLQTGDDRTAATEMGTTSVDTDREFEIALKMEQKEQERAALIEKDRLMAMSIALAYQADGELLTEFEPQESSGNGKKNGKKKDEKTGENGRL